MVHLIFSLKAFEECLKYCQKEDSLILMQKGWEVKTSHQVRAYGVDIDAQTLSTLLLSSHNVRSWF